MRVFKFFINLNKEEKWLNEMAKQGYSLSKKSCGYEFTPIKTEYAAIKMDYRRFKKQEDFEDYCALFEDSGWQHIAGTKHSGYQYFKKADESGTEDIFSDVPSKAGRYKRLSNMWIGLAAFYIPIFAAFVAVGFIELAPLLDPKSLYLTPGLWEESGAAFWGAFLFETPFALFRGALFALFPIMIMLFLIFAFKANKYYQSAQSD
ncbi:DUF2812 domain-containing protein [Paenibacillus herberti]|uniref:DUF2812 domain-containing protein n=1 Tax=Paenibacillus herberti TaxID=1619309 RepID=A0A229P2V9_9BACL|nr:DUF2812 domain-containing protein [Paenibacillus herberti]OXM16225.1 hypothetical protein CGZ75_05905 [Paenibacillus herberti]